MLSLSPCPRAKIWSAVEPSPRMAVCWKSSLAVGLRASSRAARTACRLAGTEAADPSR